MMVMGLYFLGAFDRLENVTVDLRFNLRGNLVPSPDVALIEIDEKSVQKLGRFPWNRSRHADLIAMLTRAGAKSIAFDVLFSEPDELFPDDDAALGQAAAKSGKVTFGMLFDQNGKP